MAEVGLGLVSTWLRDFTLFTFLVGHNFLLVYYRFEYKGSSYKYGLYDT